MAWVILENHYHVMAHSKFARDMPTIMGRIHGSSSIQINRQDKTPGRRIWWNYWDTCILDERDYENRLAYIYWNPLKHKVASDPAEYPWSSVSRDKLSAEKVKAIEYKSNSASEIFDDFDKPE